MVSPVGDMKTSGVYRSAFCIHYVNDREVSWPRAECPEHYQLAAADYHNSSPWRLVAGARVVAGLRRVLRVVRPGDARTG